MSRLLLALLLTLGLASPSWAAIAVVSSVSGGSPDGNTFTSGTFDSTGATLIVCGLVSQQGVTEPVVTDSKGNTYVTTLTPQEVTASPHEHIVYIVNPTVGASHSFTITQAGALASIACVALSGAGTVGLSNGASSNSLTVLPTGSIATSAGSVAVAVYGGSKLPTIDNSFTIQEAVALGPGVHYAVTLAYKLNPGTVNPSWSYTLSNAATTIAEFVLIGGTTLQSSPGFLGAIIK